jgi:ABC-2 family transporter protein
VITVTMPALAPLPWRRMAWVTWRQHRLALAGVVAVFGAPAVYLLITGLPMHSAYGAVSACRPLSSSSCRQVADNFLQSYSQRSTITAGLLQALPALIGAFVGAPVLARELETGTFRYAWTQGFGRARWTVAKLTSLAVAVTLAAGAFSLLCTWYYQPIISAGGDSDTSSLAPTIFDLRGIALPAWTLAAFAIGALAGILIRRVTPAMFATIALWVGLAFLTGAYLRPRYEAPLVTSSPNTPAGAFVIDQGLFRGGKPASLSMINQTLRPVGVQALTPELFQPGPPTPANFDPLRYLTQHGYTQLTAFQPAARFWTFQWIEGGWLLALSLLLITATVRLVHRRSP